MVRINPRGSPAPVPDTGTLSLLNFTPEPTAAEAAVANAKKAARDYFAQKK
jgi:hypothetical protein